MTTRQFITRAFNDRKTGKCSSVFADNGDVYSYGYHYPLLFRVHGQAIRNVRGYSNTTQRHIQWSRDVDAIDVHCYGTFRLIGGAANDDVALISLIASQRDYIDSIQRQMDAKKRKNTQVYKWLEFDLQRANDSLRKLEALK
jgi:hypothetical protein